MNTNFTSSDLAMFRKLRVPKDLLAEAGVRRVTNREAYKMGFRWRPGAELAGIVFPYFDASGELVNARLRRDRPEIVKHKTKNKYITLSKKNSKRVLYFLPDARKLLTAEGLEVGLVESEKAMLALNAAAIRGDRALVFVALGGCWGWREKLEDSSREPLADVELLRGIPVRLILDANVATNDLVMLAETNLAATLGENLRVTHLPAEPGINGPDDFLEKHGDAAFWELWDAPAAAPAAGSSDAIFWNDPMHVAVEKSIKLLSTHQEYKLYRRENDLVHVVEETRTEEEQKGFVRPRGNTYLTRVDAAHLEMELSRTGSIFRKSAKTDTILPAEPKLKWAEQMIAQLRTKPEAQSWLSIQMVSNVPVLLEDGSVVDKTGYDATTGVWFDPRGRKFPTIPIRPTKDQAAKAMKKFEKVFGRFPMDKDSQAAVYSTIFSVLLRHLLPTVPALGITGPDPGSGKSKLAASIGAATTGCSLSRMNYDSKEEFDKQLPVPLATADRIILIDNVRVRVTSDRLSTALVATNEEPICWRVLGESRELRILNRSVFIVTGNQLSIGGDLPRRFMLARLIPNTEFPEARVFDFDPPERGRKMFPELAVAALTAARYYLEAGCPQPDYKSKNVVLQLGNFEKWARIVRGLLVHLDLGDPAATQQELRAANSDVTADKDLLRTLWMDFGKAMFTVAEIDRPPERAGDAWKQARKLLLRGNDQKWDANWAGYRMSKLRDRVMDGLKVQKVKAEHGSAVWQVVEVEEKVISIAAGK